MTAQAASQVYFEPMWRSSKRPDHASLLHCKSPELAHCCRSRMSAHRSRLGGKQTRRGHRETDKNDPTRTSVRMSTPSDPNQTSRSRLVDRLSLGHKLA